MSTHHTWRIRKDFLEKADQVGTGKVNER